MSGKRIAGIVLVVLGLGVAYTGYQMSGALSNQLNEAISGSPTDDVIIRYIGGALSVALGAFLAK